jgi:hypothetical protein
MSDVEIAEDSRGLSPIQVFTISQCFDWAGIDIPTMRQFLTGCHIDFEDAKAMNRVDCYLRHGSAWKHLRKSPLWTPFYQPLLIKFHKHLQQTKGNMTV